MTLAIANDYEVVVLGLAEMLALFSDRVRVVELDVDKDVRRPVDVALYDTFSATQVDGGDIDKLVADAHVGAVVVPPRRDERRHALVEIEVPRDDQVQRRDPGAENLGQ